MTAILVVLCAAVMWFAHTLQPFGRDTAWRLALLAYPLPGLAAWHMGAPWVAFVLAISAAGLFARARRKP